MAASGQFQLAANTPHCVTPQQVQIVAPRTAARCPLAHLFINSLKRTQRGKLTRTEEAAIVGMISRTNDREWTSGRRRDAIQ